jgi:hypothetical protein
MMIWASGPDKLCTYFNPAWLAYTGRTFQQELGDGWTEDVHPDDLPACFRTYVHAFDARKPFLMEYRLRRATGEYGRIVDQGVPRYIPDGAFAGYVGSAVDITATPRSRKGIITKSELDEIGCEGPNCCCTDDQGVLYPRAICHSQAPIEAYYEKLTAHLVITCGECGREGVRMPVLV